MQNKPYIEITSLYHPSLSISKKRNPYLPYLFLKGGMSQEIFIFCLTNEKLTSYFIASAKVLMVTVSLYGMQYARRSTQINIEVRKGMRRLHLHFVYHVVRLSLIFGVHLICCFFKRCIFEKRRICLIHEHMLLIILLNHPCRYAI